MFVQKTDDGRPTKTTYFLSNWWTDDQQQRQQNNTTEQTNPTPSFSSSRKDCNTTQISIMTSSTEEEENKKEEQTTETISPLFDGTATADSNDNVEDGDHDDGDKNKPTIVSFASEFRDKVRVLFDHFDQDHDGFLNFKELKELQDATSGSTPNDDDDDDELDDDLTSSSSPSLTEEMYVMACKTLNCQPSNGLSLEALKFTYAADGADIDKDFKLVFTSDGKPRRGTNKEATRSTSRSSTKSSDTGVDDAEVDAKKTSDKTASSKTKPQPESSDHDDKIYEVGADGAIDISS